MPLKGQKMSEEHKARIGVAVSKTKQPGMEMTKKRKQAWRLKNDRRHPEKQAGFSKKAHVKLRTWLDNIKANLGCSRCPESTPICLDFHHLDTDAKTENVGTLVNRLRPKEVILAEIEKCEVLCANCHRKRHRDIRDGIV